ncbi:MAG: energy-coupling factor transporter transmembrane component T, partial [Chloroflexota bacterium]
MKQELDAYAHLDSPLHRWETRYKIAGLFVLAFAFAFVEDIRLLPALLVVTAILYSLSNLPFKFLSGRLKIPGLILFGIVASLPFLSGETIVGQLGPISVKQEGLLAAMVIAVRFICIITV